MRRLHLLVLSSSVFLSAHLSRGRGSELARLIHSRSRRHRTDAPGTIWFKARQAFQYRLAGVNFFDASGDTSDGRMAQAARYGLLIDPIGSLTYSTYTL